MSKEKFEDIIITEDDYEKLDSSNPIVNALNEVLESAKKNPGLMPVLPIEGLTGSGKSSIVLEWLEENNVVNKFQRSVFVTNNIANFDLEKANISFMKADEGWFKDMVAHGGEELYILYKGKIQSINKENCIKHHLNLESLIESTNDDELIFSKAIIDCIDENTILLFDHYDRFDLKIIEAFCNLIKKREVTVLDDLGNKIKTKINCLMMIVIIDYSNSRKLHLRERGLLF